MRACLWWGLCQICWAGHGRVCVKQHGWCSSVSMQISLQSSRDTQMVLLIDPHALYTLVLLNEYFHKTGLF